VSEVQWCKEFWGWAIRILKQQKVGCLDGLSHGTKDGVGAICVLYVLNNGNAQCFQTCYRNFAQKLF
jgi:hypothetical protein